ncbi:MAG: tol-pal system protein YbgF [Acidobacteriota bacterium]
MARQRRRARRRGAVGAAVMAMLANAACLTPVQTRSVGTQIRDIRRQVEGLRDRQGRNRRTVRSAAERLTGPSPAPRGVDPTVAPPPPAAGTPVGLYRRGYALYHRGEYAAAETALRSFLAADPDGPQADNAQYWIGECYYARGLYEEAVAEFRKVTERYPSGNKAAHARYKIALCYGKLGREQPMRRALQAVIALHPDSDVAALARRRLAGS